MSVRVANCSGFYGDRLTAMREMVTGGPIDYLTGDYLAELTMLILGRDQMKDASRGYARTFVRQLEDCLGEILERGIKVVANAGGLNPSGLVTAIEEVAAGLGLAPSVAYVDGDDLRPRAAQLGLDGALTANAYLGAFGIAEALTRGADIVVTGRVTDASVVVGPGIAAHGWTPSDHDALAGAVVAGHVIECGAQATGGNFSGFLDLPRSVDSWAAPLGFPVAELDADGSSVITKHDGTGGAVTVDTVTAQLMYEIQTSTYLNPDVAVDLDSVRLAPETTGGPDRVRISGVRGGPPPAQLKVSVNTLGGFRNAAELVITGLDAPAKEAWVREQLEARLDPRPTTVVWTSARLPEPDADSQEAGSALLRVAVQDVDANVVGRAFSGALVELALASYPGFTMTAPPGAASPYGVYRPAYVDRAEVAHIVHVGGEEIVVPDPAVVDAGASAAGVSTSSFASAQSGSTTSGQAGAARVVEPEASAASEDDETPAPDGGAQPPAPTPPSTRLPLGTFVHARSGDKGGDANVGLWVRQGPKRDARVAWLLGTITPGRVRALLPEAAELDVEVYPLPHLGGVNVLIRGLLGEGVAASTRFDPQAKGLGEHLRARLVDVPEGLIG
ncbi:hypothetical protein GCM10011519_23540 [Marmoricola endophyticus]|uniref:DUF1446 domain-containing protein n=1 Tax=Marmoricola endophyticus TaxID=2040280 RepID=A0A917BLE7_9ACTN|nr:acyclic terpene utilization AtuA family protein [Marmoricola endophyticus]GGF48807.1 hypothetical protein GCM10011519_23540 [Marmoricola endophyticus]